MLNWIVLNRTDYLHKNEFDVKKQQRLICHKNPTNQPIKIYSYLPYIIKNAFTNKIQKWEECLFVV